MEDPSRIRQIARYARRLSMTGATKRYVALMTLCHDAGINVMDVVALIRSRRLKEEIEEML